jgi:peptide/nickel transport system substrate-binding protein
MTPGAPTPRTSRRQFLRGATILGVAAAGGSILAGCGTQSRGEGASGTRAETLFIAGLFWGAPTTFNPLNPTVQWPCQQNGDAQPLLYETLLGYNVLDGSLEPILAESHERADPATIAVKLHPDAKWHDGKPVTADDVIYTFELAKRHTAAWYSAAWNFITGITKDDGQTVRVALDPKMPNAGMAETYLSSVLILPAHVWEGIERENKDVTQFANLEPVGSGPYKLASYNANQVVLERFDDYWGRSVSGGLPAPRRIVHPIFKDNAAGNLAFERGEVDVSQQFAPQIWQMWEDKNLPVGTWLKEPPYHIPGNIPMLVVNTTKPGLNNPKVRLALAHAIDYARIAETAMSKYSDPANSSIILPRGAEAEFFDKANVEANGWTYDPDRAKQILEQELGAKKGGDGVYQLPDGTKLGGWTVQTPTGWSDWQTAAETAAENLKALGIGVTTEFPQAPQVTSAVQNGDFDLAVWSPPNGASPGSPWARFRDVLDSRGVPPPGQSAFYNFGRFSNKQAEALLDQAASAEGAEAKRLFAELDKIFMQNAPMIPLMYRPLEFYEFNESVWKGFPTADNPYAPPMFQGAGIKWLYEIKAGETEG